MRSRKRYESVLVVCICLGLLLTLFTAHGHPFQAGDGGIGMKDDPAENQPLSLSERDASQQENDVTDEHDSIPTEAGKNLTGGISTTISTNLPTTSYVAGLKVLNSSSLTKKLNSVGQTTALPKLSVSIIATTLIGTGSLHLTSVQSRVNTKLNPSQTINTSPKSFNGTHLSTSTNSLRNLTSRPPTGNHSAENSKTIHVFRVASTATPILVSHVLNTVGLSTKVLTQSSVAVRMNPSKSTTLIVKPTTVASSSLKTNVQAKLTSSAKIQDLPSSKVAVPLPALSSASVKSSLSGVTSSKVPYSGMVPSQTALNHPSPSVVPTTKNVPGMPSTQQSSKTPPTTGKSEVPSTGSTTVPSSHSTPEVSTSNTKQSTQTSKPPSTKTTTVQSTKGPGSSLPPTTEVTVPLSTSKAPSTTKPPTTEVTTEKKRKPTTQPKVEISTKHSSVASSSSGVPSTGPEEPTKPEATKKITTKAAIGTEKITAEEAKTKNENNDEGRMPPPNKGREAVVWDFIVPVGIGTGVALAIAFGVILVRACRRRRLVKVRFGGKPSHPRLLNNDLINLLAESDDEEE